METLTIKTRDDITAAATHVLGFTPSESLVIVGIGCQPHVRVDLPTNAVELAELIEALTPAYRYWQDQRLLVAIYTDKPRVARFVERRLVDIIPLTVANVVACETFSNPEGAGREVLIAQASEATEPAEAEARALKAFKDGQGALAWCYVDRARELAEGQPTPIADVVAKALVNAVDPGEITRFAEQL